MSILLPENYSVGDQICGGYWKSFKIYPNCIFNFQLTVYLKKDIEYRTENIQSAYWGSLQPVDMMEGGEREPQILAKRSDLYQ